MKLFAAIGGAVVALVGVIALFSSWYTVGPGQRGIVVEWGAAQPGAIAPGLHFKMPFRDSVEKMSVQVQKFSEPESAASKDLQNVTTTVAVNFSVVPTKVANLYTNVGDLSIFEKKILNPAVANAVKAATAQFNAEDLIVHRNVVYGLIEQLVRRALAPYNVSVQAVNITNFKFSEDYSNAIEKKQIAQQRALQATYELQQAKVDAQKQVAVAQAHKQATILQAEGDAKALELKRQVLTSQLLELTFLTHWNGQLPTTLVTDGSKGNFLMALTAAATHGSK